MWRASRQRAAIAARAVSTRTTRRGVSLFEAVAALAIVGTTSAGVLAAVGAGTRTAERARAAHEAEALALELYARLAVLDAAALRVLPDSLAAGRFDAPFDRYTWRVAAQPHGTWAGLHQVRIEVQWPTGVQQLETALYRRPTTTVVDAP